MILLKDFLKCVQSTLFLFSGRLPETDKVYCSHPGNWKEAEYLDTMRDKLFKNVYRVSQEAGLSNE